MYIYIYIYICTYIYIYVHIFVFWSLFPDVQPFGSWVRLPLHPLQIWMHCAWWAKFPKRGGVWKWNSKLQTRDFFVRLDKSWCTKAYVSGIIAIDAHIYTYWKLGLHFFRKRGSLIHQVDIGFKFWEGFHTRIWLEVSWGCYANAFTGIPYQ